MRSAKRRPIRQSPRFLTDGELYFAWNLARELSQPDPNEMLRHMSSRTFAKWRAFYRAEDILRERAEAKAKMTGGG